MRYRKKPVEVTVIGQWSLEAETTRQFGHVVFWSMTREQYYVETIHLQKAYLDEGDWIIVEPDGQHCYPCKPDIFKDNYELIKEDTK